MGKKKIEKKWLRRATLLLFLAVSEISILITQKTLNLGGFNKPYYRLRAAELALKVT